MLVLGHHPFPSFLLVLPVKTHGILYRIVAVFCRRVPPEKDALECWNEDGEAFLSVGWLAHGDYQSQALGRAHGCRRLHLW